MLTNEQTIGGTLTMFPSMLPPRSRLFHLKPVVVGTPYVESLTVCSACYDECAADGMELYDQLLWAVQCVTVCAKHQQRLEFVCPRCKRGQRLLSHDLRPGFCGRCQSWLGNRICNVARSRKIERGN